MFDDSGRERSRTLSLREPVLAFPGVRFVVRRVSPKTLLGGGEIVSLGATQRRPRSPTQAQGAIAALLAQSRARAAGARRARLCGERSRGCRATRPRALARTRGGGCARATSCLRRRARRSRNLRTRVIAELESAHEREPWAMGATSLILARTLGVAEPLLVRLLATLVDEGRIAQRHGYYATTAHQPKLSAEQRAFFEAHVPFDAAAPFLPVPFDEVAGARQGVERFRASSGPSIRCLRAACWSRSATRSIAARRSSDAHAARRGVHHATRQDDAWPSFAICSERRASTRCRSSSGLTDAA